MLGLGYQEGPLIHLLAAMSAGIFYFLASFFSFLFFLYLSVFSFLFFSSTLAGVAVSTATSPIWLVKTRMQLQTKDSGVSEIIIIMCLIDINNNITARAI